MTNKTKYHYFDGTAEYTRINAPDSYGNYVIKLKMTDEEILKYEATGIQGQVGEDNTVFFRRPSRKIFNNELQELGAPELVDAEGKEMAKVLIGTGSKVTIKVTSYPTMKGTGHTLQKIQLHELVPVESANGEFRNF